MRMSEAAMDGTPTTAAAEPPLGLWRLIGEDIRCVFQRDPAARTRFEVVTTYPGVHAVILHRIAHRLWRRGWRYAARFIAWQARVWTNVDIHPGATIGWRFFIDHGAGVVVGETAVIGNDVTLYHGVTLGGTSWNSGRRHPTLGDGVLVGAGAKVLGPVTLGDRVRVGANSVVIGDVPEGRTVVGIPGKVVRPASGRAGEADPARLDLDHHLIPDPVGRAIACLIDRIEGLEEALRATGTSLHPGARVCRECGSMDFCEDDAAAQRRQQRHKPEPLVEVEHG